MSLSWMAPTGITAWIVKHRNEFVPLLRARVNDTRTVTILGHKDAVTMHDAATWGRIVEKYAKKFPGQYWLRADSGEIKEVLVIFVEINKEIAPYVKDNIHVDKT